MTTRTASSAQPDAVKATGAVLASGLTRPYVGAANDPRQHKAEGSQDHTLHDAGVGAYGSVSAHYNVAADLSIIANGGATPDAAVMPNMTSGHKHEIILDHSAGRRCSYRYSRVGMNRATASKRQFATGMIGSSLGYGADNSELANFIIIAQFRTSADDREGMKSVPPPETGVPMNHTSSSIAITVGINIIPFVPVP